MNKRLKQLLSIVLVLTFVLIGCSNNTDTVDEKTTLEKIQEKGVIVVGTSPDYPPFETIDDNGNIVGFDIDLLNEIATNLGVKVELKEMSFDTIITAVKSGQVDIGMSCFSIDPDRLESVDFSDPYLVGGQVIVTTVDSGIAGPEDLNGEKVAVGIGTTGEAAANNIEGAEVTSLDYYSMGFMMLKNGTVKAVVADLTVANEYVKKDDYYVIVGDPLEYEETAIVIAKENDDLTTALNKAIADIKESGKLDEIKKAWDVE